MKILVLGATGMLGSCVYRLFAGSEGLKIAGTIRGSTPPAHLPVTSTARIIGRVDVTDFDRLTRVIGEERPDVVVNCVGVVKQLDAAKDPVVSITLNALLPHRLAALCAAARARLIHISTDCVFDGKKGNYKETDFSDATDLYGRAKYLGEVDYTHAITLRTSIVGHEIGTNVSLIDWFLSQPGPITKGYRKAVYTGLPTVELARVIRDYVLPRPSLRGVWHVSSAPINKFDLLAIVARIYGKKINIVPDDAVEIDRSLDGSRFCSETGFVAEPWPELVKRMHDAR